MDVEGEGRGIPVAARVLVLLLLPFLLYLPSFRGGWVYDDHPAIEANEGLDDTGARAREALLGRRTFTDFTFALNRAAGGNDPLGYRLVNAALHGGNACLLFLLGAGVFRRLGARERAEGAAWAAALLFAAHPLLSQAVAYTAQRYTSLATFFYLLAAFLYLRARERNSLSRGIASFLAAYLAMRCKEIAFTLPFAMLLLEAFLFRGKERRLRAALPFLLLLPLIPLSLLAGEEGASRHLPAERLAAFREAPETGRLSYLASQFGVMLRYLFLLLLPHRLTVDHDPPAVDRLASAGALLPLAALLAVAAAAWLARRRLPVAPFAAAWFFLTLSVESSLVPIRDLMVEHRVYLPSVGFFLAAGGILSAARRRFRTVLLVLLLAVLGALTFARSGVWADRVSLWEDAARKAPARARPRVNLGLALYEAGRYAEAAEAYGEAVRRDSALVEGWTGLGASLGAAGREAEALGALRRAMRIAPDYGPAYDAAADLHAAAGRTGEARETLRLGLKRAGPDPLRLTRYGELLLAEGRAAEAERAFRESLRLRGATEAAAIGRARALHSLGRTTEAEQFLLERAMRRPSPHLWNGIGVLRLSSGRTAGAAEAFRRALLLDPGHREARANLERMERRGRSR